MTIDTSPKAVERICDGTNFKTDEQHMQALIAMAAELHAQLTAANEKLASAVWRTDWENAPISDPRTDKRIDMLVYGPEVGIAFGRVWRFGDEQPTKAAIGFNGDYEITHFMPLTPPDTKESQS